MCVPLPIVQGAAFCGLFLGARWIFMSARVGITNYPGVLGTEQNVK